MRNAFIGKEVGGAKFVNFIPSTGDDVSRLSQDMSDHSGHPDPMIHGSTSQSGCQDQRLCVSGS